jgi:peptidoglycan/LPS O-acetylase OafA/YrhL
MNTLQSRFIDFVRGSAAVAVLAHHYLKHYANQGAYAVPDFGQEAVIVFFVLSGFVIAMVSETNERDFVTFAIKRLSRFYSVVVPGVVILLGCYVLTMHIDPSIYPPDHNLEHGFVKTVTALTFTNHNTFLNDFILPGGGPYWSLSYEFWYYFLFACIFLISNKVVSLLGFSLIAAFLGNAAMLLFPIWCQGVIAFKFFKHAKISGRVAWILCIFGALLALGLYLSGLRHKIFNAEAVFHQSFDRADYFPYYLFAIGISANMVGSLSLLRDRRIKIPYLVDTGIQRVAQTSFLLYIIHMPLMFLLKATIGAVAGLISVPLATWLLVLIVGKPIEDLRFPLQRLLWAGYNLARDKVSNRRRKERPLTGGVPSWPGIPPKQPNRISPPV